MTKRDTAERLANIEALLDQVLKELRGRRRTAAKRTRTVGERALAAALKHPDQPTELEIATARRALRRHRP
jgi:hypothetical protein